AVRAGAAFATVRHTHVTPARSPVYRGDSSPVRTLADPARSDSRARHPPTSPAHPCGEGDARLDESDPMSAPDTSVPFSFEVYPARTTAGMAAVTATVDSLAAAGPEFVSVTFGAAG